MNTAETHPLHRSIVEPHTALIHQDEANAELFRQAELAMWNQSYANQIALIYPLSREQIIKAAKTLLQFL